MPSNLASLSYRIVLCASLFLGSMSPAYAEADFNGSDTSTSYSTAFLDPEPLGSMQTNTLSELSGLVASKANPGLFWAHNDSGDSARVFLIDPTSGEIKLEVNLEGVNVYDCEDITIRTLADGDYLVLGDIGDNRGVRDNLALHQFKEPRLNKEQRITIKKTHIQTMPIAYKEGARDAETLMSTPDGQLIIITKREEVNYLYQFDFAGGEKHTLTARARIPMKDITAGDINSDGAIVLRTYAQIYYWPATDKSIAKTLSTTPAELVLTAPEPQGEALAWGAEGSLLSIPEKPFLFNQVITRYSRAKPLE